MTNDPQKSDLSILAMKSANKPEGAGAEPVERRGGTEGNTQETHTRRAQDRVSVTTGLDRVRERAKERKEEKFTTLLHHVDTDLLRRAYFQLKRKAAPGVDRVTWQAYGEQLEANLADLHERVHRGRIVQKNNRHSSGCGPMVVAEHSAEALSALNRMMG